MARRRRSRSELNAEINVVSLIDVMMLLLVIFMITAPMMQGGIEVQLPKGESRPLEQSKGLVVTVKESGRVAVDRDEMSFEQFRATYKALAEQRGKEGVFLRADERASYGSVVRIMGVMMRAGTTGLGIVVEPEETR